MKNLRVRVDPAHSIDTEVMRRAINMLEVLDIYGLDIEQAAGILRNLVEGESNSRGYGWVEIVILYRE